MQGSVKKSRLKAIALMLSGQPLTHYVKLEAGKPLGNTLKREGQQEPRT